VTAVEHVERDDMVRPPTWWLPGSSLAPLSVTYSVRSSGEKASPFGLSKESATTDSRPDRGSNRYT
jgi:hypothetical protein